MRGENMSIGRLGLIESINFQDTTTIGILIVVGIAIAVIKGLALWHSARRKQTPWFIIILITNTLGILPIIYLLINKGKKVR